MPDVTYPKNPNSDTVFVEDGGKKTRAIKTVEPDGTVTYPSNANSENCYVTVDGKKQRALMTAPQDTSTLEYPNNPNSTKGYVTVNGKKQRVVITANISGGGGSAVIEELNVTPSTSAQTITASGGTDGYSPVNVAAVDASIDANIVAGNIKDGVQILGVTGNYTGGAPALYREFQLSSGTLIPNTTTTHIMNFTGMTDVQDYALYRAYFNNHAISGAVDMSDLTTISGNSACHSIFYNCTGLTSFDLSALTTISASNGCYSMLGGCTGLTSANLSALTTISGSQACAYMFQSCTGLTSVDLSSLTTVSGNAACQYMFNGCTSLTTVYIGGTTAIDFSTRTNQFTNMFSSCTQNIDVYAPAANQAKIESFSGYPNFGATGTVTWHWRS